MLVPTTEDDVAVEPVEDEAAVCVVEGELGDVATGDDIEPELGEVAVAEVAVVNNVEVVAGALVEAVAVK